MMNNFKNNLISVSKEVSKWFKWKKGAMTFAHRRKICIHNYEDRCGNYCKKAKISEDLKPYFYKYFRTDCYSMEFLCRNKEWRRMK